MKITRQTKQKEKEKEKSPTKTRNYQVVSKIDEGAKRIMHVRGKDEEDMNTHIEMFINQEKIIV